jgi:hypothetical protein
MPNIRYALVFASLMACAGAAQAQAAAPGRNFDLSAWRLQTLDGMQRFSEVSPVGEHQDPYFFTDPKTGAMIFRAPSGAGHSRHSEYPRVELRQIEDFTMDASGARPRAESMVLRVLAQPKTGKLIFAQIHGETAGTELLKMRWTNGNILMSVKAQPGAREQQIPLLHAVALGDAVECRIVLHNGTVTVSARSGGGEATRSFAYDGLAWKGRALYFKAGSYAQDKERDGSEGIVAVQKLTLSK